MLLADVAWALMHVFSYMKRCLELHLSKKDPPKSNLVKFFLLKGSLSLLSVFLFHSWLLNFSQLFFKACKKEVRDFKEEEQAGQKFGRPVSSMQKLFCTKVTHTHRKDESFSLTYKRGLLGVSFAQNRLRHKSQEVRGGHSSFRSSSNWILDWGMAAERNIRVLSYCARLCEAKWAADVVPKRLQLFSSKKVLPPLCMQWLSSSLCRQRRISIPQLCLSEQGRKKSISAKGTKKRRPETTLNGDNCLEGGRGEHPHNERKEKEGEGSKKKCCSELNVVGSGEERASECHYKRCSFLPYLGCHPEKRKKKLER